MMGEGGRRSGGGGGKNERRKRRRTDGRTVQETATYLTRRLMDALILERKRLTGRRGNVGREPVGMMGIEQWVKNFAPGHLFFFFFFCLSSTPIRSVGSY